MNHQILLLLQVGTAHTICAVVLSDACLELYVTGEIAATGEGLRPYLDPSLALPCSTNRQQNYLGR